jgi:hypothetical protein
LWPVRSGLKKWTLARIMMNILMIFKFPFIEIREYSNRGFSLVQIRVTTPLRTF